MRKLLTALVLGITMSLAATSIADAHYPVANRYSRVSQWYSSRHLGIDLASYCGTKIVPVMSGTVIFAGWKNNGGGWQVWVRTPISGLDYYSIYAHMRQRPSVIYGSRVTYQTTRLGYVGATGNATGCHLHYALWRGYPFRYSAGSRPLNPWSFVNHGYWLPYRYR